MRYTVWEDIQKGAHFHAKRAYDNAADSRAGHCHFSIYGFAL